MVQGLIERGYAYPVDGDVYFRVRSFPDYGKLSHRDLDDLLAGARIEVDERKDDPLDFALWKAAKPGEPSWESPWGPGRPGWHIECSAMSSTYLDGQVDIHGGGADLIFPHHENEIAQSEAYLGVEPFARYWVHNGLVRTGTEKMSKSLGNFVRLKEIVDRGLAPAFRLMVLQSHYRSPLTFTEEGMLAAERGLDRLRAAADSEAAPVARTDEDDVATLASGDLAELAAETDRRFHAAMDDDFNAPEAVAALFDLARAINRARGEGVSAGALETARTTLVELAAVLGLDLEDRGAISEADAAPFIDLLLRVREELRQRREWALSDLIRDELGKLEVAVEDTPAGATWSRRRG
jgi:cysteinyl-tRNA synthetase